MAKIYYWRWGSPPSYDYAWAYTPPDPDAVVIDSKEQKSVLFQGGAFANSFGNYALQNIADNADTYFSFMVPFDFVTLVELKLIVAVAAPFTNKVIKIYSNYGAVGESPVTHVEEDVTHQYSAPSNQWGGLDISQVFSQIAANDNCGLKVHPEAVGVDIKCVGIRMIYESR